jgi:hypothetical protein
MSEIYAPGSIAGAQGPAGPAGSEGSVTTLASSILPVPINLFNFAAAQQNYVTNSDGSIGGHAPGSIGGGPPWVTNLLYCPGATQLLSNHAIGDNGFGPGAYIQLFDANGNFVSNLDSMGSWKIAAGTAISLPGTQVYVRLTLIDGPGGGVAPTQAMIIAGAASSPAAIPGSFVSFAPYLSSVVDTNIAAALTTAKAYGVDTANGLCSFLVPCNANLFDPAKAVPAHACGNDGTLAATAWDGGNVTTSGMVYCPGATAFVCNTHVMCDNFDGSGTTAGCQLFDAAAGFVGTAAMPSPGGGDNINPFTAIELPGTQTYIRIAIKLEGGSAQGTLPAHAMLFAGQADALAALSTATPFLPFFGGQTLNACARTSVKKASDLGCALDCVITTGLTRAGTTPTDDTALLNTFLATASATNPVKLILDGCAYTTGLVIAAPGYTTIEGIGWQSGIFVASGANQNGITIGATGSAPFGLGAGGAYNATLPARSAANVILRDFTLNGNGAGNNGDGAGALIVNTAGILVDHVNFLQACYFALTISNSSGILVRGCSFTSTATLHDGIHLDGPVEDVLIAHCVFSTGDDAIAVNCPEGYGGDISRVAVVNCIFDNSLTAMRIYTSLQPAAMPSNNLHKARQIVVSNCTGRTQVCAFSLGINGPDGNQSLTNVNQIEDLLIENCDISSDTSAKGLGWILVSDAVGLIQARGCVMRAPLGSAPFVMFNGASQVGHVVLSDITILRNPDGYSTPALFDNTNAISVGKLTLNGARVTDEAGTNYAAIPAALVFGAGVAELVIHALDMDHFSALTWSFANVAIARGAGLLGTGAQIPDATMDSDALYLSSNAGGALSIKIGGAAKRIALA